MLMILKTCIKKMKDYMPAITWLSAGFIALATAGLKFLWYIAERGKITYWNLSPQAISVFGESLLYEIAFYTMSSIVILLIFNSPCLIKKIEFYKSKPFLTQVVLFIVVAIFLFFVISIFTDINASLSQLWKENEIVTIIVGFIVYSISTFFILSLGYLQNWVDKRNRKKDKTEKNHGIKTVSLYAAIYLIAILISVFGISYWQASSQRQFCVVENSHVIIYESTDSYYLAECSIQSDDEIEINANRQKKLNKSNTLEYEIRTFNKVLKK